MVTTFLLDEREHLPVARTRYFRASIIWSIQLSIRQPIRIPGAVQGFGVLIVLHDDSETGQLKVRQVSEVHSYLND